MGSTHQSASMSVYARSNNKESVVGEHLPHGNGRTSRHPEATPHLDQGRTVRELQGRKKSGRWGKPEEGKLDSGGPSGLGWL